MNTKFKHMVGFTCWESCDMLTWIMHGVNNAFPPGTEVIFHFDACTDDSIAIFDACREHWLDKRGYAVRRLVSDPEILPKRAEDWMMHLFMESDCDFLHLMQDDQYMISPQAEDFERLWIAESPRKKVGFVGGRDGYMLTPGYGYADFVTSPWSLSSVPGVSKRFLKPGEWSETRYLNPNPLIFNKELISHVGYYDTEFESFYHFDDYSKRAVDAGFTNYVLGTELEHARFGRLKPSHVNGDGEMSARDRARMLRKHPYF